MDEFKKKEDVSEVSCIISRILEDEEKEDEIVKLED